MGQGDDSFGRVLMKNFLMALLEMDPLPSHILFVNSGINLTTEEGEPLDALVKLKERGVDLASCGLCLDFYHRKESLKVWAYHQHVRNGRVTESGRQSHCPLISTFIRLEELTCCRTVRVVSCYTRPHYLAPRPLAA